MPSVDLTTFERSRLRAALASAFYDPDRLDSLLYLSEGLGVSLVHITAPKRLPETITEVIKWAEAEGKTDALIKAAYREVPGNPLLSEFFAAYSASAQRDVTRGALEKLTNSAVLYQEPTRWRDRMARAENCVCCVVINSQRRGTGFLIAAGTVMTNYHVIEDADWQAIQVEFDYQADAQGALVPSRFYPLTGAPFATSPWHPVDKQHPKPSAPPPDGRSLDYALLSVGGRPEEEAMVDGNPRGVIPPPAANPVLAVGMPLLILQHPKKPAKYMQAADLHPLKFAFDVVSEINENGSRVRYKVNTEPGSSGSPCFDPDWNLVAIHHSGDPRTFAVAEYNEGIPIASIRRSLSDDIRHRINWDVAAGMGGQPPANTPRPEPVAVVPANPSPGEFTGGTSGPEPPPPGPLRHADDLQKDRWGGKPEVDGRRVYAVLNSVARNTFNFSMFVESTDGSRLEPPIVVHVHDSFPRSVVRLRSVTGGNYATLSGWDSEGVFAIGVQVRNAKGQWISLEFDLASLPDLPERFRGR